MKVENLKDKTSEQANKQTNKRKRKKQNNKNFNEIIRGNRLGGGGDSGKFLIK